MKITKQDVQSMIRMYEILRGDHRKEARILLHNWLLTWGRAQKLRRKGYRVSIPPPRPGHPQLIIVNHNTAPRQNFLGVGKRGD